MPKQPVTILGVSIEELEKAVSSQEPLKVEGGLRIFVTSIQESLSGDENAFLIIGYALDPEGYLSEKSEDRKPFQGYYNKADRRGLIQFN